MSLCHFGDFYIIHVFLFSYQPAHDDELDLAIDQVIDYLGEVED